MVEGSVKFYNIKKRFGFIQGADGKDYFVHLSGIEPGQRIKEGDKVDFEVTSDERGPKAMKVKLVE